MKTLLTRADLADNLLARLEERDVALWLTDAVDSESVPLVGLPWRMVLCESITAGARQVLIDLPGPTDPLVRKRGYTYIVDTDPTRIELPQRCLPVYVLGSQEERDRSSFETRLKRMAMLDQLRRSGVKELLIVSSGAQPPRELQDLWDAGYRSFVTFATPNAGAESELTSWLRQTEANVVSLVPIDAQQVTDELLSKYRQRYTDDRDLIRVRDHRGTLKQLDITGIDDPDRPLLEFYELLREREIAGLTPDDLS
jgi:hypothetical protein